MCTQLTMYMKQFLLNHSIQSSLHMMHVVPELAVGGKKRNLFLSAVSKEKIDAYF